MQLFDLYEFFQVFPQTLLREDGNTYNGASVPNKKRYAASEIAKMRLEGLPGTKSRVIARAASEGWDYVEVKGVGGVRRLYEVPDRYRNPRGELPGGPAVVLEEPERAWKRDGAVAGTMVRGTSSVDVDKLEIAIRALTEWEAERGVVVEAGRRPAAIALLYDYLQRPSALSSNNDLSIVLRALG